MQNEFKDDYRTRYIIEKILDYLPGNTQNIIVELTGFLNNPDAIISAKHANNIAVIRDCLKDPELALMTRQAIQKKIYGLKNSPPPTPKFNYLINYFQSWLDRIKLITAPNNAINQQR